MDTFIASSKSAAAGAPRSHMASSLKYLSLCIIGLFMLGFNSFAADGTIKGTVVDKETGKPMKSATIAIPSLRIGTISDEKGEFIFKAPEGLHTLEIKYVGYETQTKRFELGSGKTEVFKFEMSSMSIQTNQIVILGLSGEVDRNKLGNQINSISGKEVAKVVSTSPIDALSGRVPGVQVTRNSGTPGAGSFVTFRGRKTISGSSEPLYVIDGIIMDNTSLYDGSGVHSFTNRASDVNPQDIESIEILKGASAAAIYGSQAANGVVLITTKRGRLTSYDKPASISYTSAVTVDQKASDFDLQTSYGQRIPYKTGTPGSSDSWGAKLEGVPTYDHSDDVFRTGLSTVNSLTIIGGVPQFDYMLNGTYEDVQGYVEGSQLTRTSIRANVGISLLPGVTLQANNNYISIDNDMPQDGSNTGGILLGSLRTPPEFDNSKYLEADGSMRRFASYDNPIWTQKNNKFNTATERFLSSTELKWQPLDWMTYSLRYGLDRYDYRDNERIAVGSSAQNTGRSGAIWRNRMTQFKSNLDLTANLMQRFMDNALALNLVFGSQLIDDNRYEDFAGSNSTLTFFDEIDAGANKDASSKKYTRKTVGYFGQLTTTWRDRLSLTLAIRRDGSSAFGESEKLHYYPKVGISYNLSDEEFMADTKDIFSSIRLRASYGEAGSPNLPGTYATNLLYGTGGFFDPWGNNSNITRGGFSGIRQGGGTADEYTVAGTQDIIPERSIEREVGIELGILDEMIKFEATFYHSDVYDMIISVPVPASSGYDMAVRNAAAMWNEGVELSIKAIPFRTEDFMWSTALNYSRNYNLLTQLEGADFYNISGGFVGTLNSAIVGRPLGTFRASGWLRDENGNMMYSTWDAENKVVVGDDWENNLVGVPRYAPDLVEAGDPNPKYMISWRNDFTFFQDLTLSFLFDGVFDFTVWNGTRGALYNFGTSGDTEDRDELWVENGQQVMDYSDPDNPVAATKMYKYRYYYNGFYINEPHMEDGSFIKLREVVLEYRWHGLKEWNIENVTFTFSARNLLTITDYSGYDPEVNTFSLAEGRGIDYFTLPQTRSYRFGISINY